MQKNLNDQVYKNCLDYFDGNTLAAKTCFNKYILKSKNNKTYIDNSPEDLIKRICLEYSRIEKKYKNSLSYKTIFNSLNKFKYIIPQGSPLFGIGNNEQITSIANCFVIGEVEDSYGGIMLKDQELTQLMKRRGGVGLDISKLRPKGSYIQNSALYSDGIGCFMERFSNSTKEVAQNGRRGALLISIHCNHPDIEEFIKIKQDLTKVNGANISIKWTDEFLDAVEKDKEFILRFPVDSSIEEAKLTKKVKAKDIWNKFITSNWNSAEPGCIFWDTVINQSISDNYADEGFKTITSNPCGEIFMSEYNSCILQVLNLTSFVKNPFTDKSEFNWILFKEQIIIASKLTDDIIDLEIEKVEKIISKIKLDIESDKIKTVELDLWNNILNFYKKGRRIGLGFTGLADMLAMLNIKYDSEESLIFVDKFMNFFHTSLMECQVQLAKERGSFPIWDPEKEKNDHYINLVNDKLKSEILKYGRRNISFSTISPTGSISLLSKSSSGIEPVFSIKYSRNRKMTQDEIDNGIKENYIDVNGIKWVTNEVIHPNFKKWQNINPNLNLEDSPYFKCEAAMLDWSKRVKLQSIIQKYITHSISSTINLPETVSKSVISEIYLTAWKNKCKGVTIYRDDCRQGVLTQNNNIKKIKKSIAPRRPEILECDIHYRIVRGKKWIFFISKLNGIPYDIFGGKRDQIEIPKKYKTGWIQKNTKKYYNRRIYNVILGSLEDEEEQLIIKDIAKEFSPDNGNYTRLISTMLRHGIPIKFICEQLYKINEESEMFSFEKGIARVLKEYIIDGEEASGKCEKCKEKIIYTNGCIQCPSCGWSKCN